MLSTIPSRRHSSAIAYSPRRPDNTIRIFSSAEYRLRVARRISRTCCSAVSDGTDFCLIFAPSRATMSQKSSLRKIPQSVSQLLTGNTPSCVVTFHKERTLWRVDHHREGKVPTKPSRRLVAPAGKRWKVPGRKPNKTVRDREYLTEAETERLMD